MTTATTIPAPVRGNVAPAPCTDHPGCVVVSVRAVMTNRPDGGTRIAVLGTNRAGGMTRRTFPYDHGARDPWAAASAAWIGYAWGVGTRPDNVARGDDAATNGAGRTVRRYAAHIV